jgi:hypothetical protein
MTEREIRQVREQWDETHDQVQGVRATIKDLQRLEAGLVEKCERLAEIIAEHDHTPIVIIEDDGGAE